MLEVGSLMFFAVLVGGFVDSIVITVITSLLAPVVVGVMAIIQSKTNAKLTRLDDKVHHELSPNHGSSMKDSLNRIERDIGGIREEMRTERHERLRLEGRVSRLED